METNQAVVFGIVITSCLIILTVAVTIVLLQLWSFLKTVQTSIKENLNPMIDNVNSTIAELKAEIERVRNLIDSTEKFYKGVLDTFLKGAQSILNKKKKNV